MDMLKIRHKSCKRFSKIKIPLEIFQKRQDPVPLIRKIYGQEKRSFTTLIEVFVAYTRQTTGLAASNSALERL